MVTRRPMNLRYHVQVPANGRLGFGVGLEGQGEAPALEDALRIEVAERYIELYERVTGQTFEANTEEPVARIKRNLGL